MIPNIYIVFPKNIHYDSKIYIMLPKIYIMIPKICIKIQNLQYCENNNCFSTKKPKISIHMLWHKKIYIMIPKVYIKIPKIYITIPKNLLWELVLSPQMEGGVSPLGFVTVKVSVRHWVAAPTSLAPPMKRNKHEFGIDTSIKETMNTVWKEEIKFLVIGLIWTSDLT